MQKLGRSFCGYGVAAAIIPPAKSSNQSGAPHAGKAVFADDDMVMHGYPELLPRVCNVPGHGNVLPAWAAIAAWVVVDKDDGRSAQVHRAPDNVARVDRRLIDGTFARDLIADQHIFAVEI